jgi:hypothetical protein
MLSLSLLPLAAQSGGPRVARSTDTVAPARGESAPSANHASSSGGGVAPSSGPVSVSPGESGGYAYGATPVYGGPDLSGTSFGTITSYYSWNDYYFHLVSHYNLSPSYFGRFYRNVEPLITPEMLKLTLSQPIRLSKEMLDSIDQLEEMIKGVQSGTMVDKQALLEKSQRIREIAKQIRKNQTLTLFDLRKEKALYKENKSDSLDPEALDKLREMAVDIDRQLKNMYLQTSTSTVSVESYSEPSLESLARGIERICKSIEHSSKRM